MATTASGLRAEFNSVVTSYGQVMRIRYFNVSGADAGYDDDVTLTKSGTDLYISGAHFPLKSSEAYLKEQGRIPEDTSIMYLPGNINTSGPFRIGMGGSPASGTREYAPIEDGIKNWWIGDEVVYKKMYVQLLTTGSLAEE